jgi:hypothetical protein
MRRKSGGLSAPWLCHSPVRCKACVSQCGKQRWSSVAPKIGDLHNGAEEFTVTPFRRWRNQRHVDCFLGCVCDADGRVGGGNLLDHLPANDSVRHWVPFGGLGGAVSSPPGPEGHCLYSPRIGAPHRIPSKRGPPVFLIHSPYLSASTTFIRRLVRRAFHWRTCDGSSEVPAAAILPFTLTLPVFSLRGFLGDNCIFPQPPPVVKGLT